MDERRIRALAICVFQYNGKILVNEFRDPVTQQICFRPVGGGIEFGETSAEAIVREVQEELGLSMTDLRLLGTLESLFVYNGRPGHEIVQVYDATFADPGAYELAQIHGHESDGAAFTIRWHDSSSFSEHAPLVPNGLHELLKSAGLLV
ncbi:NUDIX hydrolase [Pseudomonas sp. RIT288]|jgi:8-oxo-dGTP pyrophosphatase MutT (NUDIX family)|uniref:NUDIX hydrolase n=1 Tax=Pseudomonas sp. RIT288 TaxID=1470589 RepID=UPI00044989FF|nr:NUDIX hydrolase [Pseudomonas sp. RIT288]EZP26469.1 NUDIX family hydrolase [Pseudomonas sp. RIT288]